MKLRLERFLLIDKFKSLLYSVVLIPVSSTDLFLNLQYSKGTPNKVTLSETITIAVNKSASPLFYKMPVVKKIKEITIEGSVKIQKQIENDQDDSYFQLGIIYEGDYRPNGFVKAFLPEWLKKVLSLNDKFGVGQISFHEVSAKGKILDKKDNIRDIKIFFKTNTHLDDKSHFKMKINPDNKKILGFWLRADGDDSKAQFVTNLKSLKIND